MTIQEIILANEKRAKFYRRCAGKNDFARERYEESTETVRALTEMVPGRCSNCKASVCNHESKVVWCKELASMRPSTGYCEMFEERGHNDASRD